VAGVRRRWRFWRGQVHRHVHHIDANLWVPPKRTMAAAKVVSDGNGGLRPRLASSGELDGGLALLAGPVSISGSRRTRHTKDGRQ
jgi:hypothetical protein